MMAQTVKAFLLLLGTLAFVRADFGQKVQITEEEATFYQ